MAKSGSEEKPGRGSLLFSALIPALAFCLGWGIRGVFGHKRGPMVPGAMAGLSLALSPGSKLRKRAGWMMAAAVAGFSFGGEETYGQTIGLTQGPSRKQTYWWGLLGLAVKGAPWVGLGALYMGMAAGRRKYTLKEIALLSGGLLGMGALGTQLLNRPHQPPDRLPRIYFSNFVNPADPNNPPRIECWGGLWAGFLFLWAYVSLVKRDPFASRMGAWGLLGGAAGFPAGQAIQAWRRGKESFPPALDRWIDWWKVMEMTFGFIAGLALGLGEYFSRRFEPDEPESEPAALSPAAEAALALGCLVPVAAVDFGLIPDPHPDHIPRFPAHLPFYVWLLPGLLAFSTERLAWMSAVGLPFLLHAQDTAYAHWVREKKLLPASLTVPAAAAASAASAAAFMLGEHWGRKDQQAPGSVAPHALAFTAWAYSLMSAAKEMIVPRLVGPHAKGPLMQRFANPSTGTHAAFFALASLLTAFAATRES